MRILVLGSGAREHAIITALLRDGGHTIIASPGNAGIAADVESVRFDVNDPDLVAAFATDNAIDLVVIGPEAPLVAGVADALRAANVPTFGPSKAAAQLEGSKSFAKRIMDAAGVPTGAVTRATTVEEAAAAMDAVGAPWVVKADGLAAGKGVIVTDDRAAADAHAAYYLQQGPVLVEEFLAGPEVSLFLLADGTTVRPLSPAQDFKRLGDGDAGPNTGGMGAYSPLPWLAERFGSEAAFVDEVVTRIAQPTIDVLAAEGAPFQGLLYCGLIVTDDGIKVIEFNARFGDPETQVVLPRLDSQLAPALLASAEGTLADLPPLDFSPKAAVTVVLASEGYPEAPQTGRTIAGLEAASAVEGTHVLHAATATGASGLVATGGRVLSVVGTGDSLAEARARAYEALDHIRLRGGQARRDIAEAASA